jgi:hypothetical protein
MNRDELTSAGTEIKNSKCRTLSQDRLNLRRSQQGAIFWLLAKISCPTNGLLAIHDRGRSGDCRELIDAHRHLRDVAPIHVAPLEFRTNDRPEIQQAGLPHLE